jgi:glycerophosphoryl diester phosphodiesterase
MPRVAHDLRLYGHRGASALLPENTVAAFRRALEDGANALELDVHRTADGHLVVAHDPDGRRMAGVSGRIRDLELSEVTRWSLVGEGVAGDCDRHTIPTLEEVLRLFPTVPISVDVKPNDPRTAAELIELIATYGDSDRITIGSFHDRLVRLVRRLGYPGPTALTRSEVAAALLLPTGLARRLVRGQAAMIPRRSSGLRLDTSAFIERCRELGLRVDFWVVNDPGVARGLLAAGATGLVSDDPAVLTPVFERLGQRP